MTLAALLALAVASAGLIALPNRELRAAGAAARAAGRERTEHTSATVALAGSIPVPRSFLGLSTEYWTLPMYAHHAALVAHVLSLLRPRGGGPVTLRVGGDSASHTRWDPRSRPLPGWEMALTPGWLNGARVLAHRAALRLILDLNLSTGSPATAAGWAAAARAALPGRAIAGFEIGNEPDVFDRSFRVGSMADRVGSGAVDPAPISATGYARRFTAFSSALAGAAPDTPLLGPALASPRRALGWIPRLLAAPHHGLRTLTAHSYPFSACAPRSSEGFPTIARLLHPSPTWAATIAADAALAHRAGMRFSLTELNSVSCGGRPGVSDSFATALWSVNALFTLVRAGVDAVDLHARAFPVNAPFTVDGRGLHARPLLYGLTLFTRALGPEARLVRIRLGASGARHLEAWAVRLRGGILHVLVIDTGRGAARVRLRVRGRGHATAVRLSAPSLASRTGVTLAGQHLDRAGRWAGRWRAERLAPHRGGYRLTVAGDSAALVTIRLR